MKGVTEWIWLIAGIIAALIIFTMAMVLYQNTVRASIEKKSIEDFSKVVKIINNMCWEFEGNTREYTLELGETIQGIYAANMPHDKYEAAQLTNNIITGQQSSGNNLCLQIQNKKEQCEQLDCNVNFPFIGAVPEEFSLSVLINQLTGRGKIYNYYLQFVRTINPPGVLVSLGPIPTTTIVTIPTTSTIGTSTTVPGSTTTLPGPTTTILGTTTTIATTTTLAGPTTTTLPGPSQAILLITVNDVVSRVGASLDQYKQALSGDGLTPVLIRLDVDSDVKGCDAGFVASSVPVSSSNAQRMIPGCITKYNAKYVVILGGHNYIMQKEVPVNDIIDEVIYSDDWYADISGNDGIPDVPIGRIPDGISHGDNVISNYIQKAAIPLHNSGWGAIDPKYAYAMRSSDSDSYSWEDSECFIYSLFGSNCGSSPDCKLSPPNLGVPPGWSGNSKIFYLDMHGDPEGYQQFMNDHAQNTVGASDTSSRNWDKTSAMIYPCYGGRIHNVDLADSFVLNVLDKGAVLIIGGTGNQLGIQSGKYCDHPPEGANYCFASNIFYKFAKGLTPGTRIGEAFRASKQGFFSECSGSSGYKQGHQNVFYGDPSIRV